MIEFKSGDILHEDVEALINTVNCVGVMGRGIAFQFKNAYPNNFKVYEKACKRGEVQPGEMLVYETNQFLNPRFIINFPTKRHWRGKSRIEDIQSGLNSLVKVIHEYGITSIAVPPLGCGLGGLDWSDVKLRIIDTLKSLNNVHIIVFEPTGAPATEVMSHVQDVPIMTPGRAALVELINRYLSGLLDPFVTLLEVHKLMYFLQEVGEPLKLKYEKAQYGPYAENLRHVLNRVEGHYITGYSDGGDSPRKQLMLVPGAVNDAKIALGNSPKTFEHTSRVSDLVDGFESPFGLELLSTIHWVITRESPKNINEVISFTYSWNDQKRRFSPRQIELAVKTLINKHWVSENLFKIL